ncbi:MAG: SMI1/KNR4 family protein, partial [Limisphaerales bacterium]
NRPNLWKEKYDGDILKSLCFAEDIFGGQFCIQNDAIVYFEPETGEFENVAKSLEDWARLICKDYEVLTGYPLARAWQLKHGALPIGKRLIAKLPFVLGGEYNVNNLAAIDAQRGMLIRANLAEQIKHEPDGSKIQFKIVE